MKVIKQFGVTGNSVDNIIVPGGSKLHRDENGVNVKRDTLHANGG